jgi:hypothetical protein
MSLLLKDAERILKNFYFQKSLSKIRKKTSKKVRNIHTKSIKKKRRDNVKKSQKKTN